MDDFKISLTQAQRERLTPASKAQWARFVLRGLINYHERMTLNAGHDLDCWKEALEYALACVEEKAAEE